MSTPIVSDASGFSLPRSDLNVVRWNIYFGFAVLAIGVLLGLDQAFNYARIDIFRYYPGINSYYQGLTIHGIFNALVLTTAFANGFIALTTARGLGRRLNPILLHSALAALLIGSLLASYAMLIQQATVLYTFYPPLEAHWTFYLGLALVVISTWITSASQLAALRGWRKDNPGRRIPLLAYMSIATYVMWDIASVGIAVEVVALLLPWSLGLLPGSDPMLSRTLFWFTGHPIVYFWLLPVYVSWYGMIPKQAGGVLFSDTLTRVAFVMFILLVPVGFHHQFVDPGVSHVTGAQVHGCGPDLRNLFSQPDDRICRDVRAGDRGTAQRRQRVNRMVFPNSMG
jgi:cytochrome c oxidase subunit I